MKNILKKLLGIALVLLPLVGVAQFLGMIVYGGVFEGILILLLTLLAMSAVASLFALAIILPTIGIRLIKGQSMEL